jgi:hypothetical protein
MLIQEMNFKEGNVQEQSFRAAHKKLLPSLSSDLVDGLLFATSAPLGTKKKSLTALH